MHNQIIFLFDNDAEGFDACQSLLKLTLSVTMWAMKLPELEDFRHFPALGPDGVKSADINRRPTESTDELKLIQAGGQAGGTASVDAAGPKTLGRFASVVGAARVLRANTVAVRAAIRTA